jgi:hypothetical protein
MTARPAAQWTAERGSGGDGGGGDPAAAQDATALTLRPTSPDAMIDPVDEGIL